MITLAQLDTNQVPLSSFVTPVEHNFIERCMRPVPVKTVRHENFYEAKAGGHRLTQSQINELYAGMRYENRTGREYISGGRKPVKQHSGQSNSTTSAVADF